MLALEDRYSSSQAQHQDVLPEKTMMQCICPCAHLRALVPLCVPRCMQATISPTSWCLPPLTCACTAPSTQQAT
jgi:hypothetical protein